jgi:hypothetical protein
VALYSGNRSKKYSPPAGAFTDGGFAVTTPTLAAFGNGTNILLAVGSVSGADSTRVYRGTGAGTQTSLASINALDNPYTDTTAAANTDYWYKVRQYDVATAQWSNYSAVSGPVRWTSVPSGDPAISGVTGGSLSHGETVTISGTNFGFKSQGPPLIWETFESGSNGQLVRDVVGWQPYSENRGGAIYSTLLSHGGANSVYSDALVYGDYFGSNKATVEGAHDILFSSCWWRTNNVTVGDDRGLIKLTRFSTTENWYQGRGVPFISGMSAGSGGGGSQSPQVGYYNSSAVEVYTNVGPGGAYLSAPFNAWTRVDLASQLSTAGASDGWIWGAITGPTSRSVKAGYSIATRGSGQTFQFKGILLPTMSTNQYAATPYGDYQLYCDDVYVDNTLARVEIGNESTYDECTHLEIQIPSRGRQRPWHHGQHRIVRQRPGVPVCHRRGRHGFGRTGHHDQQLAEDSPVNFDMTLRLDFLLVAASVLFFVARLQSKVDGLSSAVERITKMLSDVEIRVRNTELDVAEHMGESKSAKGARGL